MFGLEINMEFIEIDPTEEPDPILALAIKESSKSPMKFKLGAVIVKRGRVIGWGYNTKKTHPRYGSKDGYKTMHAEGNALYTCEKLGNNPSGSTMIVYRKGYRNSKPCPECLRLIEKAGIKKVVYSNYE